MWSTGKIVGVSIASLLGIAVVVSLLGLAFGWIGSGAKIVSAENVRKQHEFVISQFNAMDASAKKACSVQKSYKASPDAMAPTLVENPVVAYEATFFSAVASYNSAVDNIFKAGIVAPSGYPDSVDVNLIDTEDWCTVSSQLLDTRN